MRLTSLEVPVHGIGPITLAARPSLLPATPSLCRRLMASLDLAPPGASDAGTSPCFLVCGQMLEFQRTTSTSTFLILPERAIVGRLFGS